MDAPREPVDAFYATLRLVARFWVWFFFKAVSVRHGERVPDRGPVLLCINHPNNLIDSLLIGAVLSRKVHYLATASLFRSPVLAAFLSRAGVIPVRRREDDPDRSRPADRNAEAFLACRRALEAGRLLAIYPEGTTHAEARVQRIKTGAARIAIEYAASGLAALALVPVGLSFEARKSFRGPVLVAFGAPIAVAPYVAPYRQDPLQAVHDLTIAIQAGMEALVVHVERIDTAALVQAVEALYRDQLAGQMVADRGLAPEEVDVFRLSRTIAEAAHHFKAREPERVERLWRRIEAYRTDLATHHLRDRAVRAGMGGAGERHLVRAGSRALVGFPLFAYGAAVNGLPYLIPRWLARRAAHKETDYATIRLLASIVAFPFFWAVETWVVWRAGGAGWAAAFALSLPVSGLFAYRYGAGAGQLGSRTRFGILALTHRQAAMRLLAERQAIIEELERAKADYLAAARAGIG